MKGNNDCLSITQPEMIKEIHTEYLEAGAELIGTNTFSGTTVAQADYKMESEVDELNIKSTEIARGGVPRGGGRGPDQASLRGGIGWADEPHALDLAQRGRSGLPQHHIHGARGGIQAADRGPGEGWLRRDPGGDDLRHAERQGGSVRVRRGEGGSGRRDGHMPLMISGTIVDQSGRTLSGQTTEAFYVSMRHSKPFSIGLNCALGAKQMLPFLTKLSNVAECFVTVYSNAGLPNAMGGYDETPEAMAEDNVAFADAGLVNMVGGCCGSQPSHIAAIAQALKGKAPRPLPELPEPYMWLSGLEDLVITKEKLRFVNIGERCNIAGSIAFKKLVLAGDYQKCMEVAAKQVAGGAHVVDINLDDGLLDGVSAMQKFCKIAVTEPDVSKVPFMIDSSKFEIVEAGLQCVQGRCIVNSISLKVGEELFKEHARIVKRYGAAVVVMAFDEEGQAATLADKVRICKRSYDILVGEVGFLPEDIIFDPNILTIATGMNEHNAYGVDFINATRQIKMECPFVKISGGVSNLSFGFRGVMNIREAIHSVFLYHAVNNGDLVDGLFPWGLDMGIVNAANMEIFEDLPADLLPLVENCVLNKNQGESGSEATEALLERSMKEREWKEQRKKLKELQRTDRRRAQGPEGRRPLGGAAAHAARRPEHAAILPRRPGSCRCGRGAEGRGAGADQGARCEADGHVAVRRRACGEAGVRARQGQRDGVPDCADAEGDPDLRWRNGHDDPAAQARRCDVRGGSVRGVAVQREGQQRLPVDHAAGDDQGDPHGVPGGWRGADRDEHILRDDSCAGGLQDGERGGRAEHQVDGDRGARRAARWRLRDPTKPRFVAGSAGPTNRTLSISPNVEDPGFRNITFMELVEAYKQQIVGLVKGGCDVILVETIFDTLNAKAALYAFDVAKEEGAARWTICR